ncbi:MAG: N-acetylneuraminate synthase [Lachnospiraceae bacterium]|nr:N-acetylneuraminate synthase [Lachnospiraceae bacterium]
MKKITIIAEAGVNHNGDLETAKKLVKAAKECGADIVKFQTFHVDSLVSGRAEMAQYQKENIGVNESQKKMLEKLALSQEAFVILSDYCREIGIRFLSTPFDIDSVRFLNSLQDMWKIPSGEITNYPYLVEIAETGKDVILSTGMSTLYEVREAVDVLKKKGAGKLTLLHCTTQYPTPMQDVNLKAIETLRKNFGCEVGYSDHTPGIEIAVAAAAVGAVIIEKHFTLDKNMNGPDHKASLEPEELKAMVMAVRNVETAMGDGEKKVSNSEKENIAATRKSIVAKKNIKQGALFTEDNITTKRPGTGISPMYWNKIVGSKATRDYEEDALIEW